MLEALNGVFKIWSIFIREFGRVQVVGEYEENFINGELYLGRFCFVFNSKQLL